MSGQSGTQKNIYEGYTSVQTVNKVKKGCVRHGIPRKSTN